MRKVADCRLWPSQIGCSLTIAGAEDEVVAAAAGHAAEAHGHIDGPELRRRSVGGSPTIVGPVAAGPS
jgi:hypothetical protein